VDFQPSNILKTIIQKKGANHEKYVCGFFGTICANVFIADFEQRLLRLLPHNMVPISNPRKMPQNLIALQFTRERSITKGILVGRHVLKFLALSKSLRSQHK
jgi:hypothetical protein